MRVLALVLLIAVTCVLGQQAGSYTAEKHPTFPVQQCTNSTGCKTLSTSIVLDANWRWLHKVNDYTNCFTGSEWDTSICSSPTVCAQNCAVEGADYEGTYGVKASGNSLSITLVTRGEYSTNVGARVYLLSNDTSYLLFKLKGQEFTFDVDVSNLPCGLNGALYTTEMAADGGLSKYPTNKAGAKFGTGYCDAQCPHDMKFINGEANLIDWNSSPDDPNSGTGLYGTCCTEMDIWEANSMATAYTPHLCSVVGQTRCNGTTCGEGDDRYKGYCDKSGCDFNSYRNGNTKFYGKGLTVDTSKVFTVTTQWITDTGAPSGKLVEVRRFYTQGGKVIPNSQVEVSGMKNYVSVTDQYCKEETAAFNDQDYFETLGGLTGLGQSLDRGHVLSLSLWDDHAAHMLWLDSDYPLDVPATNPGIARGPCATSTGVPSDVEQQTPGAHVIFSNIKFGDIGSTTK